MRETPQSEAPAAPAAAATRPPRSAGEAASRPRRSSREATPPRRSSRELFIRATAQLLRRRGYAASALNEIVARSGAPKGSLYFHFPGGKEELAATAIGQAGEQLRTLMVQALGAREDVGDALALLIDALCQGLEASGFRDGCPVATVALETASESEVMRTVCAGAFDSWLRALEARLLAAGMSAPDAARRALLVLAAIEGALILARARGELSPLLAVREELLALTP